MSPRNEEEMSENKDDPLKLKRAIKLAQGWHD